MRLNDEERAMLAGEFGEPRGWAIAHQIAVAECFDAADFVAVSQAHIMADTESLGEAGVRFLEGLAAAPQPAPMTRDELTRKILSIKRAKRLSWETIVAEIGGGSAVYLTAALMGQMKLRPEQAE